MLWAVSVWPICPPSVTRRMLQTKFADLLVSQGPICAASGAEGLMYAQTHAFDLILLDMHMPPPCGPDGLPLTQAIRRGLPSAEGQANRQTCIVALTTECEPSHREIYRSASLDGLIPKPLRQYHLGMFLRAVAKLQQGHANAKVGWSCDEPDEGYSADFMLETSLSSVSSGADLDMGHHCASSSPGCCPSKCAMDSSLESSQCLAHRKRSFFDATQLDINGGEELIWTFTSDLLFDADKPAEADYFCQQVEALKKDASRRRQCRCQKDQATTEITHATMANVTDVTSLALAIDTKSLKSKAAHVFLATVAASDQAPVKTNSPIASPVIRACVSVHCSPVLSPLSLYPSTEA